MLTCFFTAALKSPFHWNSTLFATVLLTLQMKLKRDWGILGQHSKTLTLPAKFGCSCFFTIPSLGHTKVVQSLKSLMLSFPQDVFQACGGTKLVCDQFCGSSCSHTPCQRHSLTSLSLELSCKSLGGAVGSAVPNSKPTSCCCCHLQKLEEGVQGLCLLMAKSRSSRPDPSVLAILALHRLAGCV